MACASGFSGTRRSIVHAVFVRFERGADTYGCEDSAADISRAAQRQHTADVRQATGAAHGDVL